MANTDQKLVVSELDFAQIKNNLKNFLRDQSEFSDFDFEPRLPFDLPPTIS